MPQNNDHVRVSFEPDGTPLIDGYAAFGEEPSSPAARRQSAYATAALSARADPTGFGSIFRRLEQGEWDARSAGGATLLGTRDGVLSMSGGGTADLRLIRDRAEMRSRAQLTVNSNFGVEVRAGVVRRRLTGLTETAPLPTQVNAGAIGGGTLPLGSSLREWSVTVGVPTSGLPGTDLTYADSALGTLTTALGTPVLGIPSLVAGSAQIGIFPAAPLRARQRHFDATGVIPNMTVQVDLLGNVQVESPTAPVGLSVLFPRVFVYGTAATYGGAQVFLGSEGALGHGRPPYATPVPTAVGIPQGFVLGTAWTIARRALHTAIGLAATTAAPLAAAATPAPTSISAFGGAMSTFLLALAAALTKFETDGGVTGYVSTRVWGE